MDINNKTNNIHEVIVDEIALNGLEGVGFDLLWKHLQRRLSTTITPKLKERFWKFIRNNECIMFFELPQPLPRVDIVDRFTLVDNESGQLLDAGYIDGPYEYCPVDKEHGSCKQFKERKLIELNKFKDLSYDEVWSKYGDKLVLVASLKERWKALAPHLPSNYLQKLTQIQYCFLELVGRARENGQMSTGKTNLSKLFKEAKLVFYNKKILKKLDLIEVCTLTQITNGRGIKVNLMRLKRFHKPVALSLPKFGVIRNVFNYLNEKDDYSDMSDLLVKKGLLTLKRLKKLKKTVSGFHFQDKEINYEDATSSKKSKQSVTIRKSFISLKPDVDEQSDSNDDSDHSEWIERRQAMSSMQRQAYMKSFKTGRHGLTQIHLSELLGSGFYTSRQLIKLLKDKHLVRQFYEDKGRQRTARFVAVAASVEEMIADYATEKRKLMEYLKTDKDQFQELKEPPNKKKKKALVEVKSSPKEHSTSKINNEGKAKYKKVATKRSKKAEIECHNQGEPVDDTKCGENVTNVSNDNKTDVVACKRKIENVDNSHNEEKEGPPSKKKKIICNESTNVFSDIQEKEMDNFLNVVTEITILDNKSDPNKNSMLDLKKNLSLRQLKFVNGMISVIKKYTCIPGYQQLGTLICKETGEPTMDTKGIKRILQRLIVNKQVKIYKIQRPKDLFSVLICSPHISITDPIIKKHYNLVYGKIKQSKEAEKKKKNITANMAKSSLNYAYPKFLKIQKFHEFVMKMVYFNDAKNKIDPPEGFISLLAVVPELPVEFVIGNISVIDSANFNDLNVNEKLLSEKLGNTEIYHSLVNSSSFRNSLTVIIKSLAVMGLIQIIDSECFGGLTNFIFYVNRCAKILDTKGVWPRKEPAAEITFNFISFDDVKKYWINVYETSISTTIVAPRRTKHLAVHPMREQHEVINYDNGARYGDGLGPCGFHSSFYTDKAKLWCTFYMKTMHKTVKLPPKKSKVRRRAVVNKVTKPRIHEDKKQSKTSIIIKRNQQSLVWTQEQDLVMLICLAASTIMSPNLQPGLSRLRNTVAKDILTLKDQTKVNSACHKRFQYLESEQKLIHYKEFIIHEMRRRRNLIYKYDDVFKKIRSRNVGNITKFINDAKLVMLELVWIIFKVLNSDSFSQKTECIVNSVEEFHRNFIITSANDGGKQICLYKTLNTDEIEIGALLEGILLSVILTYENKESSLTKQIYEIFKNYPEHILRTAVDQLRKSGAITVEDKFLISKTKQLVSVEISSSPYKLTAVYQRRWCCGKFNKEFFETLGNFLKVEISPNNVKASSELNCLLCEHHTVGIIDIVTESVPVITANTSFPYQEHCTGDLNMNVKLKSGTVGWRSECDLRVFDQLYENLKIEEKYKNLCRNSYVSIEESNTKPNLNFEDKTLKFIIDHLKENREQGATYEELKALCWNDVSIVEKLRELESAKVVKRVGYYHNRVVLLEHIGPWTISCGDNTLLPTPWLTLDCDFNHAVFYKWAITIINTIMDSPGCSISYISNYCEFLSHKAVQDIVMFLDECKCVSLKTVHIPCEDLFSVNEGPEIVDFNPFDDPENIIVFPVVDTLNKFAHISCCLKNISK